jgi:hypothetical protein
VLGRFRTKADSQQFRSQCRAAIAAATLDEHLFEDWCVANYRRRVGIKTTGTKVTSSSTRARIEQAEQQAYEKLLAALPQQDRIAATVMETSGDVKELVATCGRIEAEQQKHADILKVLAATIIPDQVLTEDNRLGSLLQILRKRRSCWRKTKRSRGFYRLRTTICDRWRKATKTTGGRRHVCRPLRRFTSSSATTA